MPSSIATSAIVLSAIVFVAFTIIAASLIESPMVGLLVPIAAGALVMMLIRPMWGLLPLVLFCQLDALANIISEGLPISIVKILTFVVLASVIINSYRESRTERLGPREPTLAFAAMFGVTLFISALFAEDISLTLWSLQKLGGSLILFYLMVRLLTGQVRIELAVLAIVVSTFFSALIVLFDTLLGESLLATSVAASSAQFEGISRSAGASDRDPTTAATMLLAGSLLAMFLAVHTRRWLWLNLTTAVIGSAAMMMTFARSSAVAFGIAVVWLVLKFRRHRYFPGVIAAALMVAVMATPFVPTEYWDRLASITDIESDPSLQRRVAYNMIGLELLIENPLLGVGPGNFRFHYADERFRWYEGRTMVPRLLHNMYLSIAVNTGLVGFACFMAILLAGVLGLEDARRHGKSPEIRLYGEAVQFCFVAYLIASMFTPNEYNKYTWLLAGLAIAVTRAADIETPRLPLLFRKRGP